MGFYERAIFPRLMDKLMSAPYLEPLRSEALESAHGRVLEIGFGTGLNLGHYPNRVTELTGVDVNPGMNDKARERVRQEKRFDTELVRLEDGTLPFEDDNFDTAVTTFTLCTVPQVTATLAEVRRVLKPSGRLLVLEHGLAEDAEDVQRWQRRLNGLMKAVAVGCNLDRPIRALVERGGFSFDQLRTFYLEEEPRPFGYTYLGQAIPSSA